MLLLGTVPCAMAPLGDVARALVPADAGGGSECVSLYWQQAHRAPGPAGYHADATREPKGGYMPSQAGEAWGNLRRRAARKALRAASPSMLVVAVGSATCVSFSGSSAEDSWCSTNCLSSPPNCPPSMCKCDKSSQSPEDPRSSTSEAGLSPGSLPLKPAKVQQQQAQQQQQQQQQAQQQQAQQEQAQQQQQQQQAQQAQQQPTVSGNWTTEEHVNCYNGFGATGAPADAFETNVSLADCKAACLEAPACQAILVKGPRREGPVMACYMRNEVDLETCVHNSDGFALFTLQRYPASSPAQATPAMPAGKKAPAVPTSTEECDHLLPVNVSDVDVTTDETDAATKLTPQLATMRRRANVLRNCKAADRWSLPSVSRLQLRGDPGLAASRTEVIVCPGAQLAFIHVYKAAGTTIIASLHDLCQSIGSKARLICGHDNEKTWPVLQGDDQMWCDQTLAEAWDDIANYSWFTFVREPVDRFKSGTFENAYRAIAGNYSTCASQASESKADIHDDELAVAVLNHCLRWLAPDADLLDPHLKPQIDFFLQNDQVMPQLAYIGQVETLVDDWPALVSEFFGPTSGAQVRRILEHDRLHIRSKVSDHYYESLGGLDSKFYHLHMSDSVRAVIADAFRVDEVCLGYQHAPGVSSEVSR